MELRSFTLKNYSMDALKLYAYEQASRYEQQTNILRMQLNAYRASTFLYLLARQADEQTHISSSSTVL